MILYGFKVGIDEEDVIKKVIVEITDDGKVLREVTVDIDKEYKISPYKDIKMKYRDKIGVVRSFKKNEDKGELKAHIQFLDNNKFGWVDVQDLEEIK
ncbi:hypothetical protein [Carnobacterium antarcticum]|uniref:Uncharacterized protein n=1 Tax=Carnobacterium antarcticum TaxID=2126436 RepID=A0ABW4NMQ7_9LACT|nr:hypothetical protein [Carnobacterium sp. CP1]ALV20770.1 hypothetical protein NY10_145 [Carnobacterium sp. CP1]